jgi:hypothetical protein
MIDIDGVVYDEQTHKFFAFVEATSSPNPKPTTINRKLAKMAGAYTILVRHAINDEANTQFVRVSVWKPNGWLIYEEVVLSWEELTHFIDVKIPEWFATDPDLREKIELT